MSFLFPLLFPQTLPELPQSAYSLLALAVTSAYVCLFVCAASRRRRRLSQAALPHLWAVWASSRVAPCSEASPSQPRSARARVRARIRAHARAHARARSHTRTHTRTRTRTRAHAHAHAHARGVHALACARTRARA
eukprot:5590586-Pleurochrysis_carterae.AAC.1